MKISYLITCHNEVATLHNLLIRLFEYKGLYAVGGNNDDEIVIIDDFSDDRRTLEILKVASATGAKLVQHKLTDSYGDHKNFGIEQCSGDWIFQIDADEMPSELTLGENLKSIIESNPTNECFLVPRLNDFRGVKPEHAMQWGWRLTESKTLERPVVNWPDYQYRIYKKDYPRISYKRRLHEKIEGYNAYSFLPDDEDFAMIHNKTTEKQVATNVMYNKKFTEDENKGFKVG
jgi:glycosyltransferase involved in cell wall biosynthesis